MESNGPSRACLSVSDKNEADNPWLAKAGSFADDPTWDDFMQSMADYRRNLDAEQSELT